MFFGVMRHLPSPLDQGGYPPNLILSNLAGELSRLVEEVCMDKITVAKILRYGLSPFFPNVWPFGLVEAYLNALNKAIDYVWREKSCEWEKRENGSFA